MSPAKEAGKGMGGKIGETLRGQRNTADDEREPTADYGRGYEAAKKGREQEY